MCDYMKEIEHVQKREKEVFEKVKNLLPENRFEGLLSLMEDSSNYNYKIVDKPVGDKQTETEYGSLKTIYVNQTENGGYTGDSFSGTICVRLNNGKYFKFNYAM